MTEEELRQDLLAIALSPPIETIVLRHAHVLLLTPDGLVEINNNDRKE